MWFVLSWLLIALPCFSIPYQYHEVPLPQEIHDHLGAAAGVAMSGDGKMIAVTETYFSDLLLYKKNSVGSWVQIHTAFDPQGGPIIVEDTEKLSVTFSSEGNYLAVWYPECPPGISAVLYKIDKKNNVAIPILLPAELSKNVNYAN